MASHDKPICVTGANGFIAGHIVELLLREGHTVHATVRDPSNAKNRFLLNIADRVGASANLRIFKADLLAEKSFDEAVKGCGVVIHAAAVVVLRVDDPVNDLIKPCVVGVENVVGACLRHNVPKLVYTSSVGTIACHDDFRPLHLRGTPFTEEMWLTHTTPTYASYNYAKIAAERRLNEMWPQDRKLVSILPSWCVGPQQNDQVTTSNQVIKLVANKETPLLPRLYFDMVDVRDVARAHVLAATTDMFPNGRYNVSGNRNNSLSTVAEMMNAAVPGLNSTTRMAPYALLWLKSWVDKRISTQMLRERTEQWAPISNEKVRQAGFTYRYTNLVESLRDAVDSFRTYGIIQDSK
ncbi:epimerase-like protein, putative [Bodo saltans]|uniref:Epimerase-like protein, putative n=1 Tax=Bodo saltans TaxID=75058 RepID=A0A0S4ITX8_BODSA|nr:epimerase-like protein, putative [Bodo saltans]|eukprot:CUF25906.1 epimerase-like protein, putative [Bodo saltans]